MPYVTLNPETRKMILPEEYRHFGVESDEKSKRIEFQFPRFVDDIDLNDFNLYINYSNANDEKGLSIAEDVTVSEDEITFAWVLSRHVTEYKGNVNFIVCAKKNIGEFRVQNEWNTRIATADVEQGLEVHHLVESMSADAINKLMSDLLALEPEVEQNTTARHTHPNKSIIDDIGDVNGELFYKGLPVSTSDPRVDTIISLIPDDASETNQLADTEFVNDSISKSPKFLGLYKYDESTPYNANDGDIILRLGDLLGERILQAATYLRGTWTPERTINILSTSEYNATHSGITSSKVSAYDNVLAMIPEDASSENQLADKAFVNESVSINAAYFRGTFNSLAELQAYSGTVTNNDYAYVIVKDDTDPNVIKSYQRYKYSVNQWLYEFEIGIHDLTTEQLAAINSGITSNKVAAYDEIVQNVADYGSDDGEPTFSGNKLAYKTKEVIPLEFASDPVDLIVRPNWYEVDFVRPGYDYIVGCSIETVDGRHIGVRFTEGIPTCLYVGNKGLYPYSDTWVDYSGNPVDAPDLSDVVIARFEVSTYAYTDLEDMQPWDLASYRSLCRMFNVSLDAMGEALSDDQWLAAMPYYDDSYYPIKNRKYTLWLSDVSTTITLPEVFPKEDAKVEINIHKRVSAEIDIAIIDANTSDTAKVYGGVAIDFTDEGDYRMIAVHHPHAGWCVSAEKMEEPS